METILVQLQNTVRFQSSGASTQSVFRALPHSGSQGSRQTSSRSKGPRSHLLGSDLYPKAHSAALKEGPPPSPFCQRVRPVRMVAKYMHGFSHTWLFRRALALLFSIRQKPDLRWPGLQAARCSGRSRGWS